MADVRLDFYDLDDEALPDMCMKCTEPPVVRKVKTFTWWPYWARFVPFGIFIFMKRRRVSIPLCERHKGHFFIRYLIGLGGLGLVLLLVVGGGVLLGVSVDSDPGGPGAILGGLMLGAGGILFLAWLITLIVVAVTMITVVEITNDDITLKNVSWQFADAYREQLRGGPPDTDDMARRQWARPSGRGEPDYDAPPRRPRPDAPPDDKYTRG